MHSFTHMMPVPDYDTVVPYDQYLFVSMDYGTTMIAAEISDNAELDLDYLIREFLAIHLADNDNTVDLTCYRMDGPNFCAIYTDNRQPADVTNWRTADFYIE